MLAAGCTFSGRHWRKRRSASLLIKVGDWTNGQSCWRGRCEVGYKRWCDRATVCYPSTAWAVIHVQLSATVCTMCYVAGSYWETYGRRAWPLDEESRMVFLKIPSTVSLARCRWYYMNWLSFRLTYLSNKSREACTEAGRVLQTFQPNYNASFSRLCRLSIVSA